MEGVELGISLHFAPFLEAYGLGAFCLLSKIFLDSKFSLLQSQKLPQFPMLFLIQTFLSHLLCLLHFLGGGLREG